MILLVTTKSFYGIEDVSLESKLLAELTGIFNWCLTGRARLYQRGYFVEPKASRDMKVQIDNLNSPINLFLNDCTEPEPHSYVTKGDLYEAYRIWCGDQGLKPQTQPVFGKMLRAARPEMIDHRVQENSVRKPIYWHKTRGLHGSLCHFSVFRGEVVIFSSVFLVTSSVWPSSGVAVAQENYGCYATFKPNTVLYLKISYIAFF